MTPPVFRSLDTARDQFGPCALAIGVFDGVHIGHQELIRRAVHFAEQNAIAPAVLTFDPHPTAVVAPDRVPQAITSMDLRLRYLAETGVARIFVLQFTEEIAHLSPHEFVEEFLVRGLQAKAVFVGENFRFGYKQSGTPEVLRDLAREYGFVADFVPPVKFRGQVVSSSQIRRYLQKGSVAQAGRLLGRCFAIEEAVVKGQGIGSRQTVPTLNIHPGPEQLVPQGVYITETYDRVGGHHWRSITNAGFRPTFHGNTLTVETFVMDPFHDERPERVEVQFQHFVRPERQFADAAALKSQIMKDLGRASTYRRRREWARNLLAALHARTGCNRYTEVS